MKEQKEFKTRFFVSNPPPEKIVLRGYQMHDNIILSNFENITQLEVSGNNIEYLDLSRLKKLQVLQCIRNALVELIIDGGNLVSLTATHNDLANISIKTGPSKLTYVDISNNKLKELPSWIEKCINLRHLSANDNGLKEVPSYIFNSEHGISLHTLQLANNKLISLPDLTKKVIHLREFSVQGNELIELPKNLFSSCAALRSLNVSYNKLQSLPESKERHLILESLLATKNQLNDEAFDIMINFRKLRIIHMAHNKFTCLPSACVENWTDLEELVFSGNELETLPATISLLKRLRVLKLHSNLLKFLPDLSNLSSLQMIDLAHNQLGKINLEALLPKNVRFLDLSCNQELLVDSDQLKTFQAKRYIYFVDVSGKDRFSLPTSPSFRNNTNSFSPWKFGFSETPGNCSKLVVSQIRLPQFYNTEGLFGMFDGQARNTAMSLLPKIIPTILLQHRAAQNDSIEYMRYTLISAYENLVPVGNNFDDCAILCHIVKDKPRHEFPDKMQISRSYILRAVVVGGTTAYLIRKQGPIQLPPSSNHNKFRKNEDFGKSIIDADIFEVALKSDDEYLVICTKNIWKTIQIETVTQEIQNEPNLVLAAKKIQDIAQSFGVEGNISIIIVKFQNVETYVNGLIKELRQNVKQKSIIHSCPRCFYSCEGNSFDKHVCASNSDRSSPIGQSDQAISEFNVCLKHVSSERRISSVRSQSYGADDVSRGFPVLEDESDTLETESLLSEEQFKCWEYMLEQNTQLLFDKELNKITNSVSKVDNSASLVNLNRNKNLTFFGLMHSMAKSKMSASFPQSIHKDIKEHPSYQTKSFPSKNFDSARSFQQFASVKAKQKNLKDRLTSSGEDTRLGYFGSLQNILPHNFENEFAVTYARKLGDESVECASRMSKYWGITSTEL